MYKVFFNDREISIGLKPNITLNQTVNAIDFLRTKSDVKSWFQQFLTTKEKQVFLQNDDPEKFWKSAFMPAFKLIYAAGGIVIRGNKMLFIFRNETWDLPKGKIDNGESPENAAIREVEEECGISGHKILKQLPSTFHIYQSSYKNSPGKWILKETFWFEMAYSGTGNGTPQTGENISQVRWFEKKEFGEVLANTYENLKQVILLYRD